MALIDLDYKSSKLGFQTQLRVFIPTPNSDEILNRKDSDYFQEGARFQTVYLLHGAYGDCADWSGLTSIQRYAQERKVAVVMPSAENGFYQDMFRGPAWLSYLGEELPELMCRMFPLSPLREDTFAVGLSMGGYGAWRLALTYPQRFSAAASLSGALDLKGIMDEIRKGNIAGPFPWDDIFEDADAAAEGKANLLELIRRGQQRGQSLPALFQSCGTEDFTYPANQLIHRSLAGMGVAHTWEEHPGIHDWLYWDTHVQRALDWLPLRHAPRMQEGSET